MKRSEGFSFRDRGKSFKYAFDGVLAFFSTQHNAFIHLFFTVVVFMAAVFFKVSTMEMTFLILAAGFVWAAELFNTAIEAVMDHITPQQHPRVKFIKDVSAAAVLVAAMAAAGVGMFIFIPKLF